jgi:hypothetical protein
MEEARHPRLREISGGLHQARWWDPLQRRLRKKGSSHHAQVLGSKLLGGEHCDANSSSVSSCKQLEI